jgi:hypothetical protein
MFTFFLLEFDRGGVVLINTRLKFSHWLEFSLFLDTAIVHI